MTDIDGDLKRFYNKECGLNIVRFDEQKVRLDSNGNRETGKVVKDLETIRDDVLSDYNWGVVFSTDTKKCGNIIMLDWDDFANEPPAELKKLFSRYRQKNGGNSYHGIVRVENATPQWCDAFRDRYDTPGKLEIFSSSSKKNFVLSGVYDVKNSNGGGDIVRSHWFWIDDLKKQEKICTLTKEDLGRMVMGFVNHTNKRTSPIIRAGGGQRHKAILDATIIHVAKTKKDNPDITTQQVFDGVMESAATHIEGMDEYRHGTKQNELMNIIQWAMDNVDADGVSFGMDYILQKGFSFVHLTNVDTKKQFNLWVWDGIQGQWTENTIAFVLSELQNITHVEGFNPSKRMAESICDNISASEHSRKIDLRSDEYAKHHRHLIPNRYGQVFNLQTGEVSDIDPERMFFKKTTYKRKFDESGDPDKVLEYFRTHHTPDDMELELDFFASMFLHAGDTRRLGLTSKRALTSQGDPNSWKSLKIELIQNLLSHDGYSNEPISKIGNRFQKALIADRYINLQEESDKESYESVYTYLEIITKTDGTYEVKNGGLEYMSRVPVFYCTTNLIKPKPHDISNEAFFKRNLYTHTITVPNDRNWGEVLMDDDELDRYGLFLLKRASDIYNKKKEWTIQNPEQAEKRYNALSQATLLDILMLDCEFTNQADEGMPLLYLKYLVNKRSKNHHTNKAIVQELEDYGVLCEKRTRCWVYRTNIPFYFTTYPTIDDGSEKIQQTIITGIKPREKKEKNVTES